jgi:large subunit ribosomal protein L16
MLQPKRTKFRKAFKGRIHGDAKGGTDLNFGAFGLKAMEPERITARQIEAPAARSRVTSAAGTVVDPHLPGRSGVEQACRSPHGLGQGQPGILVARVKPGRILFELDGVPARSPRSRSSARWRSCRSRPSRGAPRREPGRRGKVMAKISDLTARSDDQLQEQLGELKREQFNLRFQAATNQLEKPSGSARCAAPSPRSRRSRTSAPLPAPAQA